MNKDLFEFNEETKEPERVHYSEMTKSKALSIKADVEKLLKRHKIWYSIEYKYKSDGLDAIRFRGISIKIKTDHQTKHTINGRD